jgi:hypothetical protein
LKRSQAGFHRLGFILSGADPVREIDRLREPLDAQIQPADVQRVARGLQQAIDGRTGVGEIRVGNGLAGD